jgi:hypothetical protein
MMYHCGIDGCDHMVVGDGNYCCTQCPLTGQHTVACEMRQVSMGAPNAKCVRVGGASEADSREERERKEAHSWGFFDALLDRGESRTGSIDQAISYQAGKAAGLRERAR